MSISASPKSLVCKVCLMPISNERHQAGYRTCKLCGDKIAAKEITTREKSVAPAFNKGGYQPVASRQAALDVGRKDSALLNDHISKIYGREPKKQETCKKNVVGVAWYRDGTSFALYAGDNPTSRGAIRWCYYTSMRGR